jgi:hypothetical protein
VKERYGATVDAPWLNRVREATVRLSGCSASFVSREGLILTNHHCITGCLAENSSKEKSLLEDGFQARSREQEIRCGTQVADILVGMQDVTEALAVATRGLDDRAANEARKRKLTELEQACEQGGSIKCQSVALYNGGQYFLYKYRRYTDVRLVFAPEAAIAAFGGDPDNFQFPRWCLDMGLLRAYEGGKPVQVPQPLRIDFRGPAQDELVFVSGHPGSTDRSLTVAQLQRLRDSDLPPALLRSSELRGRYIQFAKTSNEARRISEDTLAGLENGIKVRRKLLDALLEEPLMEQKRQEEKTLRAQVAASAFHYAKSPANDVVQDFVAAAVTLRVHSGRMILHVDPVRDDHRRGHDQLEHLEVRVVLPAILVQKGPPIQIDAARTVAWCNNEAGVPGKPPFRAHF